MQNIQRISKFNICPLCRTVRWKNEMALNHLREEFLAKRKELFDAPPLDTALAMKHFDAYYSQIYKDLWPSIRVALRTRMKYVAVVNHFVDNKKSISFLRKSGRKNIIPDITTAAKQYLSERKSGEDLNKDVTMNSDPDSEKSGGLEQAVVNRRKTLLSNLARKSTDVARTNVSEFVPVTEVITEHEIIYRADKNSRSYMEPILEWDEESASKGNEWSATDLELVHEDAENFNISPFLQVYSHPRGQYRALRPANEYGFLRLNGASILSVLALNLKPNDVVLDMCAGGGCKTMIMMQTCMPKQLVCVDNNASRLGQLHSLITHYGPGFADKDLIRLVHSDGRRAVLGSFDKILVDVPNSADRFVSTALVPHHLFNSARGSERLQLPVVQKGLLKHSLRSCRVGGEVVYSTCTLSVAQNELIVRAALAELASETGDSMRFAVVDLGHLRYACEDAIFRFHAVPGLGLTVLPFLPNNHGPAYLCKLRRMA